MYIAQKISTALLAILPVCVMAMPSVEHPATEKFLSISDIHFSPFASCPTVSIKPCELITALRQVPAEKWEILFQKYDNQPVIGYLHDTNYALLKSSLAAVHTVSEREQPQFTLILGDFLAHNFRGQYIYYSHDRTAVGYRDFVKKTLQFLTNDIREALPEGDIYPALGNNDSYTGDYSVIANGEFLRDTAAIWAKFIKDPQNQKNMLTTFPIGGYYAVDVPNNKKLHIIVLDTILFSPSAKSAYVSEVAHKQLAWLHEQLLMASEQHQPVILAFHIPAGINVYKTVMNFFNGIKQFWLTEYSDAFERELELFPKTVRAILPGHIHRESIQIVGLNEFAKVPVTFTPSISPIFGNNPSFKVYRYNVNSFSIVGYKTYSYALNNEGNAQRWQQEVVGLR